METSAKEIGEQPSALAKRSFARLLLACGVIGPLIFILVFLIEGATRTNYSPLRHPVSSLSFGDFGWTQMANFVITGSILLAFAIGLRRTLRRSRGSVWGPRLMGLVGIGLIGAERFRDAVSLRSDQHGP